LLVEGAGGTSGRDAGAEEAENEAGGGLAGDGGAIGDAGESGGGAEGSAGRIGAKASVNEALLRAPGLAGGAPSPAGGATGGFWDGEAGEVAGGGAAPPAPNSAVKPAPDRFAGGACVGSGRTDGGSGGGDGGAALGGAAGRGEGGALGGTMACMTSVLSSALSACCASQVGKSVNVARNCVTTIFVPSTSTISRTFADAAASSAETLASKRWRSAVEPTSRLCTITMRPSATSCAI